MCRQKSCVIIECHKRNETKQFCFLNHEILLKFKLIQHTGWKF